MGDCASRGDPYGSVRDAAERCELHVAEAVVRAGPQWIALEVAGHLDPTTRPERRRQREGHGCTGLAQRAERPALDLQDQRPLVGACIDVVHGAAVDLCTAPGDLPAGAASLRGRDRLLRPEDARQGDPLRIPGEPDLGLPEHELAERRRGRLEVRLEPLELQRAYPNTWPVRLAHREGVGAEAPGKPALPMMTTPSRLVVTVQIEDPSHLARLHPHWHEAERPAHIDASRAELGTNPLPRLALAKARAEHHVGEVEAAAQPDAHPHDPGGAQGPTDLETTEAQERRAPAVRLEAEGRLASLARVECDGPPTRRGAVSRRRGMVR